MKTIAKVIVVIFLGTFSLHTFAQKFGIQGGINLSKMIVKDDEGTYSDDFESNLGFNAGVTLGFSLSNLIEVEVGAIAESRGFKITEGSDTWKMNMIFADIPVLLKVGPTLGPVKVFGAAGPYFGVGITGKSKIEIQGEEQKEDIQWGNTEDDDVKRMDFGAKFGIGAEAMKFTLGAYYSMSLGNFSPITDGGAKIQNRGFSISLGYKF